MKPVIRCKTERDKEKKTTKTKEHWTVDTAHYLRCQDQCSVHSMRDISGSADTHKRDQRLRSLSAGEGNNLQDATFGQMHSAFIMSPMTYTRLSRNCTWVAPARVSPSEMQNRSNSHQMPFTVKKWVQYNIRLLGLGRTQAIQQL